jgi:glycine cleavage system H protein
MNFPADLKYTAHDEWARVEDDTVVLGITDFAQDALGELVHVELPDVGRHVKAGGEICEVESVKAVASVFSPVTGEVIEVNDGLDGNEQIVNKDPYGSGWLLRIKVNDPAGLATLMDASTYQAKIGKG